VPEKDADEFGRRLDEMTPAQDAERKFALSKLLDAHHPPGSYYFLQFIDVEPQPGPRHRLRPARPCSRAL
jgi:hypothetical protein